MNIPLCGGEFCVPHDLLNDAWRDITQGQSCGGGVTAGIRRQIPNSGPLQGGVIFGIKLVLVEADYIAGACGAGFYEITDYRLQ